MKKQYLIPLIFFFAITIQYTFSQIVINEYVSSNVACYATPDGQYNDWIEIYNKGGSAVNLQGYGLTTDSLKPYKFTFPSYTLPSHGYVLVFPTNANDTLLVNHWEMPVQADATTLWKYFPGTSQPPFNWRDLTFNDAGWQSGAAGIGFGDGDDRTTISLSSRSVMMRKSFTISDTSRILKAFFSMDYDDGFVAFLNGHEIARANLGTTGTLPNYNDISIVSHEAKMYQGFAPDSFYIDPAYLRSIITQGTNVLAVEVHNESATSNDMSCIPFLTFGVKGSGTMFSNSTPQWFFVSPGAGYLNANFKLSKTGETIFLTDPSGTLIDRQSYVDMQSDNSWGRRPDGTNNWCLIQTPTPDASNNASTCYTGYANKPIFLLNPGFYPTAQSLTISNSTPGGQIRYTINGDTPSDTSILYTGPISLLNTQVIRARVFSPGYIPSETVTNTYVINETVHLPVFSITTDSLNLWDYNTGIYVLGPNASNVSPFLGANFWQKWEKPARIEYFDKQKNRVFDFDAYIKMYGNYSRAKPQKSFEIKLDNKTPAGNFKYPLYTDKPYVDDISDFVLRNSGTDWNVSHFRDAFMERMFKKTNTAYLASEPVVAYVNGAFWGVYCINENHDQHWMKNNYGLSSSQISYLKESGTTIKIQDGSDTSFWSMYNYATTQPPSTTQYYNYMDSVLDIKNHVDYFAAEIFYDNGDWIGDWTNNIQIWRDNKAGSKWKYFVYDLDFGLGLFTSSTSVDRLDKAIHPTAFCYSSNLFDSLLSNPLYRRYFINRSADLMNTIFKPSEMLPIMHQFQDSMAYDMPAHFAKWGSNMTTWQTNINVIVNFINNRTPNVRNHYQSQFGMNQQVTLTFNATPAGAGRIQVSTVIPTSYPWTGVYFDGNPVTITAIPNPGYTFNHWSSNQGISNDPNQTTTYNFSHPTETITAHFNGSAQTPQLVVSEFNYHSDTIIDASDWIEIHNYGSFTVDLTGWVIKDQNDFDTYTFPVGTVIAPNGYLVVSANLAKFNAAYPAVHNVIGPLGFNLSNGGDQIRLFDYNNQLYLSFFYQTLSPWPASADGGGYTCELTSNTANLNDGTSWTTGCKGGSPGRAYAPALIINASVAGNTNFCNGSNTVLYLNSSPGYSYQWRLNNVDIPFATDTMFAASQTGAYSVRITYQGCSAYSDTLIATMVSAGQPPVVNSNSRCGEGSMLLTASAPDSIYWFDAPNGNLLGTGTNFNTPSITSTTTFYAQTSLICPSTPVPVAAVVNLKPAPPVVNDQSTCGPGVVVLNATDTATVKWYNDPLSGALIHTGSVFVTGIIPNDSTFYAEAVSVCSSDRVPLHVTVTSPQVPFVIDASRCGSGSLVLSAFASAPVFWYDSITAGNQVGSGLNFLTPPLSQTTNYYVESNNGCPSARALVKAIVHEIPNPPVVTDSSRCGNGSVELYATADYQVFWYSDSTGSNSIGSGSLFTTPSITQTTTFYTNDIDICGSIKVPVVATVKPLPASPVVQDGVVCGSGSVTLSATSADPVYWYDQPVGGTLLHSGNSFQTPSLNATTVYYAIAINDCPSYPSAVTAIVVTNSSVFLGNDTSIISGNTLTLDAGPGFDSYLWSTGDTTQTITVNSTAIYSVDVSLGGCTAVDSISVSVVNGIQENHSWNGKINVYPNPAKDRITIEAESKKDVEAVFSLSDVAGQILILQNAHLTGGINTESIDISGLAKGVYFLTIRSSENSITMNVMVE